MNAGWHEGAFGNAVAEVACIARHGAIESIVPDPETFAYRKSPGLDGRFVTGVTLRLEPHDPVLIQERVRGYHDQRVRTQPAGARNAGCVFKNPPGDHAGRLIDAAGLKGAAIGVRWSPTSMRFHHQPGGGHLLGRAPVDRSRPRQGPPELRRQPGAGGHSLDVNRIGGADPGPFLRRDQSDQLRRSRRRRTLRRRLLVLAGLFSAGVVNRRRVRRPHLASALAALRPAPGVALTRAACAVRRVAPRARALPRPQSLLARSVAHGARSRRLPLDQARLGEAGAAGPDRGPSWRSAGRGDWGCCEDGSWLIDDEGVAIDAYGEPTKEFSFPIFTGLDERDAARLARQAGRGVALLADLESHHAGLASEISEIDLSRDDRIEVHMNDGGPIVRLHPQEFGTNLDRYLAMRDYLTTNFGDAVYVDLRFRDRIAFRPLVARSR